MVKNALLAGACGANIPAGIAANAFAQLLLPKSKAFLVAHGLNSLHTGKFITGKFRSRQALAQLFIGNFIFIALTHDALIQKHIGLVQGNLT